MKASLAAVGIAAAIAVAVFAASSQQTAAPEPVKVAAEAPQPQTISAEAAREMLASGALLADVREPDELAATGKLEGALNVPLTLLKQGSVPPHLQAAKDRPVILYCRSGRRSGEAGEILLRQGFSQVYNLGGFEAAVKAGLPAG